jgi:hypothetical protein
LAKQAYYHYHPLAYFGVISRQGISLQANRNGCVDPQDDDDDKQADKFVIKLWRMLIYEVLKAGIATAA